jgi:hypothetical protein
MFGAGEVLEAIARCHESMEAQAIMMDKIVAAQDTIGAQTTNIVGAMEQRIAAVEAGMRGIRAVQAADASQTDEMSAHTFRVEGLAREARSGLLAEQAARASVEREVAGLQDELLRSKELWETTRRELEAEHLFRVGVEGEMGKLQREMGKLQETPKQIGSDLGTARDDLEGIRGVVQGLVDDDEVTKNRVAAHGDLLKQVVRDINGMRPAVEVVFLSWVGQTVTLSGLQTARLNGLTGTVLRWDRESWRYEVDLGHQRVLVLHDNLRPAQET